MSQEEKMIRMKVSAGEAAREISQIEHKTCQPDRINCKM